MSLGGLTGAGGGSIAGSAPPPAQKQPDMSDLISYARSGPSQTDGGKPGAGSGKPDGDRPASNDSGLDVPTDQQSKALRDFDATQGRVPLGPKDPDRPARQPDLEPTCEKQSTADVALRGAGGFVEGAYSIVREPVLAVHDAAGTVLHYTGELATGTDYFEGHADRTKARFEAITNPVETLKDTAENVGGAIDEAGDGCYGRAADLGGQVAGSTIVPGGVLSRILRVGNDRWIATDVPTGKLEGNAPDAAGGADNAAASKANASVVPGTPVTPTGTAGGTPTGPRTTISRNDNADTIRSIERENESADILAASGYNVRQNPNDTAGRLNRDGSPNDTNPDYKIEGEYFDNYAPKDGPDGNPTSARNIHRAVEKKVEREQADRVILNLDDWNGNVDDLRDQFKSWPIPNLEEIIVINNGKILNL